MSPESHSDTEMSFSFYVDLGVTRLSNILEIFEIIACSLVFNLSAVVNYLSASLSMSQLSHLNYNCLIDSSLKFFFMFVIALSMKWGISCC